MYAYLDASRLADMKPVERAAELHKRKMARIRDKETNMMNRLERRRHAIWWKWAVRLTYFSAGMVGVPLFIKLVSSCWEWVLA